MACGYKFSGKMFFSSLHPPSFPSLRWTILVHAFIVCIVFWGPRFCKSISLWLHTYDGLMLCCHFKVELIPVFKTQGLQYCPLEHASLDSWFLSHLPLIYFEISSLQKSETIQQAPIYLTWTDSPVVILPHLRVCMHTHFI